MDIATKIMDFIMGIITQIMGWGSSFFGTILPGGTASDEKKNQFVKYGLIVVGLFFAAQMLRVNINTGNKSGGAKK